MEKDLGKTAEIITEFFETPRLYVVNGKDWDRATDPPAYDPDPTLLGAPALADPEFPEGVVGAFFDLGWAERYEAARKDGVPPDVAINEARGRVKKPLVITARTRLRTDDGFGFITYPIVKAAQEKEPPTEEENITLSLRPEFAVYVLSSLEVIREVLDENTDPTDGLNANSRVAALEILCRELAVALDNQASREKIDDIIQELINRYK